jgi:hypothetical protein
MAAPGASAVGYRSQSTAIFRGEDSGFFKINTGMRAPLSIEYPIELKKKAAQSARCYCGVSAMQLPSITDAACDINALRLKLNALGDANF